MSRGVGLPLLLGACTVGAVRWIEQQSFRLPIAARFLTALLPIVGGECTGHLLFWSSAKASDRGAYLHHLVSSWTIAGLLWLGYIVGCWDCYQTTTDPSFVVLLAEVCGFFVSESFLFYWIHRLEHTDWLYRNSHHVHHTKYNLTYLDGDILHVVDTVLNAQSMLLPAVLAYAGAGYRPHMLSWQCFLFGRQFMTTECHSSAPESQRTILNWVPWYMPRSFHRSHHQECKEANFGYFSFWERAFGTYRLPRVYKQGDGIGSR